MKSLCYLHTRHASSPLPWQQIFSLPCLQFGMAPGVSAFRVDGCAFHFLSITSMEESFGESGIYIYYRDGEEETETRREEKVDMIK